MCVYAHNSKQRSPSLVILLPHILHMYKEFSVSFQALLTKKELWQTRMNTNNINNNNINAHKTRQMINGNQQKGHKNQQQAKYEQKHAVENQKNT